MCFVSFEHETNREIVTRCNINPQNALLRCYAVQSLGNLSCRRPGQAQRGLRRASQRFLQMTSDLVPVLLCGNQERIPRSRIWFKFWDVSTCDCSNKSSKTKRALRQI
jgi:hypothetical protein